jgi:hypothetical protein
MVINSNIATNTNNQTIAAFAKQQPSPESPASGNDQSLLSIDTETPELSSPATAAQDLASVQQSMLQQPNLALASHNNLSPSTVFSLLQG